MSLASLEHANLGASLSPETSGGRVGSARQTAARLTLPDGALRLTLPGPDRRGARLIVLRDDGSSAIEIYPIDPLDPQILRHIEAAGQSAADGIDLSSDPETRRLARALLDGPREFRSFHARAVGHVLVARLLERAKRLSASKERPPTAPLQAWRLAKVLRFVEEHLADPIRLADLARASGLTRMYFAAQFRVATGLTPHDFVQRRRIERAQELLIDPAARLVDVALDVGFQGQAHFTTVFRRLTGTTPHRWRRSPLVAASVPQRPRSAAAADAGEGWRTAFAGQF